MSRGLGDVYKRQVLHNTDNNKFYPLIDIVLPHYSNHTTYQTDFYCGLSYHLLLYSNCLNHCQNKFRLHLGVYLNMKFFRIQLHLFMKSFLPQVYLLLYYFQQVSLKPNFLNSVFLHRNMHYYLDCLLKISLHL